MVREGHRSLDQGWSIKSFHTCTSAEGVVGVFLTIVITFFIIFFLMLFLVSASSVFTFIILIV